MKNSFQISLPNPCHEDWAAMTPDEKGKFCGACQKKVHDFTRASDRQIVEAIKQEKDLCGRYLLTQLERELIVHKEKSSIWAAASAAAITLLTIGTHEATAQVAEPTEQRELGIVKGKMIAPTVVTGVVSDNEYPLPGVTVSVEGTARLAQTDFDGKYSITAVHGQVLVFTFAGLITEKITIGTATTINIRLKEEAKLTTEIMGLTRPARQSLTGSVTVISKDLIEAKEKKRTFFGRILFSLKNIFIDASEN